MLINWFEFGVVPNARAHAHSTFSLAIRVKENRTSNEEEKKNKQPSIEEKKRTGKRCKQRRERDANREIQ